MFELRQSFSDAAITVCPLTHGGEADACGAEVKKVFSKVGISFKGQGFYKNDHGANAGSSKTGSGGSTSSSASTDSSSSSTTSGSSSTSSSTSSSGSASSE